MQDRSQVLLNKRSLLVVSVVVNGEERDRSLTGLLADEPGLRWQVAVTEDTVEGSWVVAERPDWQAGGLVHSDRWGHGVWTSHTGEDVVWVHTVSANRAEVNVHTGGDWQDVRVVLVRGEQSVNQLNDLLGQDVRGEGVVVGLGGVVLVERVVGVGAGECNGWDTSVSSRVSGGDGTRQGVQTWGHVGSLVRTRDKQVNGLVVEVGWDDVVQSERNTRRWGTVEVPDVHVVLLVVPRRRASGRVVELTTGGQVLRNWQLELTSETRSLLNWSNHNDVVTSVLQALVGSTNVGGSPTVIVGKQDSLVGLVTRRDWGSDDRDSSGESADDGGELHIVCG